MKIAEDTIVRRLDIVMGREEYDGYSHVVAQYIDKGAYIKTLRSGPKQVGNTITPWELNCVIEIDEVFANDFIYELKNG